MKKLLALIALASIAAPLMVMSSEESGASSSSSSSRGRSSAVDLRDNILEQIDTRAAYIASLQPGLNKARRTDDRGEISRLSAQIKKDGAQIADLEKQLVEAEKGVAKEAGEAKMAAAKAELAALKAAREQKIEKWLGKIANATEKEKATLKAAGALDSEMDRLVEIAGERPEAVSKGIDALVKRVDALIADASLRVRSELIQLKGIIAGFKATLPDLIAAQAKKEEATAKIRAVGRKYLEGKKAAAAEGEEEAPAVVAKKAPASSVSAGGPSTLLTSAQQLRLKVLQAKASRLDAGQKAELAALLKKQAGE